MPNQAVISTQISITRGSLLRPLQSNDTISMTGTGGPTPGTITAPTGYVVVDVSAVTTPGLCRIQNLDANNSVYVGIYSSHFNEFFPLLKLLPGTTQVIYLSDLLGKDLQPGTGTHPQDAFTNEMALKGVGGSCQVLVEIFDA